MPGLLPAVPRSAEPVAITPSVVTPLGVLGFGGVLDHWKVPARPRTVHRLPDGGMIFRWEHKIAELELLLRRFEPPTQDGTLPLADCWGAVWRVGAHRLLSRVELSARVHAVPEDVRSGYNGGQALAAVSLSNAGTVLTLGGPDEEDICSRAERDAGLPRRWAGLLDEGGAGSPHMTWGVDYLDDNRGLRWALPPLAKGEHCVLHVAVSWRTPAPGEDEDDISTWWAVLVNPEHIMGPAPASTRAAPKARPR
ncbi:hypothetical protein [Streptomyces sp. NBC_00454]|uniref:hypothetical protein n=1 Tax=Streptomyces sp. NBC_00454 TaxID=2975747 RepID=UPI00325449B0